MTYRVLRALTPFGSVAPAPVNATVSHATADLTRSFPVLSSNRWGGAGRTTPVSLDLGNVHLGATIPSRTTTSYDLQRANAAELADHDYYSALIEDVSADRAQDGLWVRDFRTLQMGAGTTTVTGPAIGGIVDPNRAMLWLCAVRSAAPGMTWGAGAVEARLTASLEPQVVRTSGAATHRASVATIEWGASWSVAKLTAAISATGGADVAINGAGSTPWSRKFALVTYRVPLGAHNQADNILVRPDVGTPDRLLAWTPLGAAAGTYDVTIYVLSHPRLLVAHWSSLDDAGATIGGSGVYEDSQPIPGLLGAYSASEVTVNLQATNTGGVLGYPRQFWGHGLSGSTVPVRRGRSDSVRLTETVFQVWRWPRDAAQTSGNFRGGAATAEARGRSSRAGAFGGSSGASVR